MRVVSQYISERGKRKKLYLSYSHVHLFPSLIQIKVYLPDGCSRSLTWSGVWTIGPSNFQVCITVILQFLDCGDLMTPPHARTPTHPQQLHPQPKIIYIIIGNKENKKILDPSNARFLFLSEGWLFCAFRTL